LKPEQWGSHLVQGEKNQGENISDERRDDDDDDDNDNNNNNNNNNNNR
jgi:hypothetical protein